MTFGLLAALLLLALVDSLNPGTIAGAVYLLLTPRPVPRVAAYVAGTYLTYYAGGMLVFFGLGSLLGGLFDEPAGLRVYVAMALAGTLLVVAGVWMQRRRPREREAKPFRWLHPALTFLFGAAGTLFDLPTALPLFVAVERIVAAGLGTAEALLALAAYVLVYGLPIVLLLGVYLSLRSRSAAFLEAVDGWVQRWSRPVFVWMLYALGAFLVANSVSYFSFGDPLL